MAKPIEKMSYAELADMQARIEKAKTQKHNAERLLLRDKLTAMAKQAGFDIHDLFGGKAARRGKGSVAVKYRDNNGNTWTGRGRMPRWMTAALKSSKAKKEDFLI